MYKFIAVTIFCLPLLGSVTVHGQARDTDVTFYNRGSVRISHIHSRALGERLWSGELLLGVIPPGTSRRVEVGDGSGSCRFDIRVIDGDGSVATFFRINVCDGPELTIKDADYN